MPIETFFFQCEKIFVPLWRHLFPELDIRPDQVNIGAESFKKVFSQPKLLKPAFLTVQGHITKSMQ